MIKRLFFQFLACSLFFLIFFSISAQDMNNSIKKFSKVMKIAEENCTGEVDPVKMVDSAIIAAIKVIDPYSIYISNEEMGKNIRQFSDDAGIINLQYLIIDDTITIIATITGAYLGDIGFEAGDKILKINSENSVGLSREKINKLFQGTKGSIASVLIKRHGELQLIIKETERIDISFNSINSAYLLDGTDIGYLNLNRFSLKAHKEICDSLKSLTQKGMKRLLLDLRGSKGGYVNIIVQVVDEFIPEGHIIITTKGRNDDYNESYNSTSSGNYEKLPLIVLIDSLTYGGSEIVAGAVQDLDRGLIVGTISFGSGTVQRQFYLGDSSVLRLTISYHYLPSGRCILLTKKDKELYAQFREKILNNSFLDVQKDSDSLIKSINTDSIPKVYKTLNGRSVYSGGCITPDYIIKGYQESKLLNQIDDNHLLFTFVVKYYNQHRSEIQSMYKNDFNGFKNKFIITADVINNFNNYIKSNGINFSSEQFEEIKEQILMRLKSIIALYIWGEREYNLILLSNDIQITKAIALFPQAEKIGEKYLK